MLTRRSTLASGGAAFLSGCGGHDARIRLRMASDNNPAHIQVATLRRFGDAVQADAPGRFRVELFHSGQLYGDRDLARALRRGDLDMAAPTMTTLSRIVPEFGITSLPAFFGLGAEAAHRVTDGPIGAELNRRLTERIGTVVGRPYVDLGHVDLFGGRRAGDLAGPQGLKVRVFSGAANVLRLRAMRRYPVIMPFADVPLALSQGAVDALETTAETVRTGRLWDAGVIRGLSHHAFFLQYVPLFAPRFWRGLDAGLRAVVADAWTATGVWARGEAAVRQASARAECAAAGIVFRTPDPAASALTRQRLRRVGAAIVDHIGMDADLAARAVALAAEVGA